MAFDIDQLYQAMDIIIDKRLQGVNYDTTIICTVVDDTNASTGKYKVSDGTIKFDAYSDTDTYKVNDAVRVSVLKGDYSERKFIVGKYIADDQDPMVTYVSPLETVIDMSGDIWNSGTYDNNIGSWGIIPNDLAAKARGQVVLPLNSPYSEEPIWSMNMENAQFKDILMNSIYDTLYIKANFKCLLGHLDIRTGNYGLHLKLTIGGLKKDLYFDVDEMFGNPYSFTIWSAQEKKFDVAKMGNITEAQLFLYQRNNFTQGGARTPLNPEQFKVSPILVKDIQIGFGSEVMKVEDNTLKIYCKDDLYFNKENDLLSNSKEMVLLWYNKDDVGLYLGFSDGIEVKDEPYDEEDYLAKTTEDTRLAAQMGEDVPNDKTALGLAADIDEIESLVEDSVLPLITRDIYSLIRNFENNTIGIDKFLKFCLSYADSDEAIDTCASTVESALENNVKYYNEYLLVAAKKQKGESASVTITAKPADFIKTLAAFHEKLGNDAKNSLVITDEISAYQSLCDRFLKSLEDLLAKLQSYIDLLKILYYIKDDDPKLNTLLSLVGDGYNFEEYTVLDAEQAIAQYGNRYCIYWYRARLGATDVFAGSGWERIELSGANGLPSAQDDPAGVIKVEVKDENGAISYDEKPYSYLNKKSDQSVTITLDPEKMSETIKAILIYNHEQFESEEIVFTNARKDTETTINDISATIYLEHGENSQDDYLLYGANNCLLNSAERRLRRKLTVHYQGIKQGDEDGLVDTEVYWYIPTLATMLTYNLEDYEAEGESIAFTNDLDNAQKPEDLAKEGFVCFYKKIRGKTTDGKVSTNTNDISFTYLIKEYYSPTFSNNVIHCRVHKGNNWYEASMYFTFSSYGTSGTDYSLIVVPSGTTTAAKVEDSLLLDISLYDYNNEEMPIPYDGSATLAPGEAGSVKLGWVGPTCCSTPTLRREGDNIIGCEVSHKTHEEIVAHYGVLSATLKFNLPDEEDETKGRMVDLTTLYPVAYSTGDYFIEGATSVIYDANGGKPSYYLDAYRIFNRKTGKEETENITWEIEYCDSEGNVIDLNAKDADGNLVYGIVASYLPKLKIKGKDYFLQPSTMYLSDIDYYATVLCKQEGENGSITTIWALPILIMQNRYSSPMLNRWDGELTIDEKNGTILSTMVGAGKKNNDNSFSGVLMGDVTAAEGSMSGLGLYGFHEGALSFGFSVEGTAFLGKSGRGRINFDGNKGTITSSSYIDNDNGRGMLIDLDNGYINLKGDNSDITINAKVKETDPSLKDYSDKPYFTITRNYKDGGELKKAYLVLIDDKEENSYYLQSLNYTTSNKTEGMKIDLLNGHIDAYDFKLTSNGILLNSNPGSGDYYISIGIDDKSYLRFGDTKGLEINTTEANLVFGDNGSFSDKEANIYGEITATAEGLKAVFEKQLQDTDTALRGEITATAETLRFEYSKADADLLTTFTSKIEQTAENIRAEVRKKADAEGNHTGFGWEITDTNFKVYAVLNNNTNNVFVVAKNSALLAGWTIDNNSIYAGTLGAEGSMWLCRDGTSTSAANNFIGGTGNNWCIAVGEDFGVHKDGTLYARNANITGNITCTTLTANNQGSIAGWTISSNSISKGRTKLNSSAADGSNGDMQIGGNLVVDFSKGIVFLKFDDEDSVVRNKIYCVYDSPLGGNARHLFISGGGYLRVDNAKGLNVTNTSWLNGPISCGSHVISTSSMYVTKNDVAESLLPLITSFETNASLAGIRMPHWWIHNRALRDDKESTSIARFDTLTTVHPTNLLDAEKTQFKEDNSLIFSLVNLNYDIDLDYVYGGTTGVNTMFVSNLEEVLPHETILTTNLLFTDLNNALVLLSSAYAKNIHQGLGHYRYLRMAPATLGYQIDFDGYYAISGPLLYLILGRLKLLEYRSTNGKSRLAQYELDGTLTDLDNQPTIVLPWEL